LPEATARFHPLFLYESISGILGAAFLIWLGFTARSRLRPGDLFLVFLIWYGTTRLVLETMRVENWTFFGVPVAQIFSLGAVLIGVAGLLYRHRRGHPSDRPASNPQAARWGALGAEWMTRPIDEPWANVPAMATTGAGGVAGSAAAATKPDWDAIIEADDDDVDDAEEESEEPPDTDERPGPTG
jgi:hypothetical protein